MAVAAIGKEVIMDRFDVKYRLTEDLESAIDKAQGHGLDDNEIIAKLQYQIEALRDG